MRRTRYASRGGAVVTALVSGLLVQACGSDAGSDPQSDELPAQLQQLLEQDGTFVHAAEPSGDAASAEQALAAFSKEYDSSMFEHQPVAYFIIVERSSMTDLKAGDDVWLIHVPDVPQEVVPPAAPPGESGIPEAGRPFTLMTDMLSFEDPQTTALLFTSYLADPPPE